jgi:ABC-2 type transport system permease protein
MTVFKAIFKREFRSYFSTPIAVIFLTVFLILNGFFTFKLGNYYEQGQANLRVFFVWHPWLYLFIVPAVSMRLWAEERRSGTIELLLTLPVSIAEAMLAKFSAAWVFLGLALLLTFPIVLTTMYLGDPDLGVIAAAYVGSLLMVGAFLAVGCCMSALTSNQVISFVVTTAACLVLILLGFDPVVDMLSGVFSAAFVNQLVNLSFPYHFEAIQRGVINLSDLVYFLSLIVAFLLAGVIIIDRKKAD